MKEELNDSVIDFPKDSLCLEVWEKVIDKNGVNEVWQLKPEIRTTIQQLVETLASQTKINFTDIHITGSITSNSYTQNADIDVHLLIDQYTSNSEQDNQINQTLIKAYKSIGKIFVGKHPIEVYFQPNKFQDLMSVGCYDLTKNKWLVGPDFTDQSFNPFSEYYQEIQQSSEEILQKIRNVIFSIYEIAIVCKKNHSTELYPSLRPILVNKLTDVQSLYDEIRNKRKVYSTPTSAEEALAFRNLRKWKVADAAFKLLDKYGYTAILKQFIEDYKLLQQSTEVDIEVIENILDTVKKYINNADKLSETEIFENEQINEGVKDVVASFALSLAVLIPGFVSASTTQRAQQKFNMTSSEIQKKQNEFIKLLKNVDPNKNMNGYKAWQALNILALTLYGEGRGEITSGGLDPIIDSILNRTGKTPDITRVANICLGKKEGHAFQYSHWNKHTEDIRLIKDNNPVLPAEIGKDIIERDAWEICLRKAVIVISGQYKIKDRKINSYYVTNMKNPPDWAPKLTGVKVIGRHTFGYLTSNDPRYVDMATLLPAGVVRKAIPDSGVYAIQRGDSLVKISAMFNIPIKRLCKLNGISSKSVLRIGQKLRLK